MGEYRFPELVYRPDYYDLSTENMDEWYPNGIFQFNVSRIKNDIERHAEELDRYKTCVSVLSLWSLFEPTNLKEEHVDVADLEKPVILCEMGPDEYVLIDGYHRLAKAKRAGKNALEAYFIPAQLALMYLTSEFQYQKYLEHWEDKVTDYDQDPNYHGRMNLGERKSKARQQSTADILDGTAKELRDCRRIEVLCNQKKGTWMSLFRLNGALFAGEAEAFDSISCKVPVRIDDSVIQKALDYQRGRVSKKPAHYEILAALIRVISSRMEYYRAGVVSIEGSIGERSSAYREKYTPWLDFTP